MTGHFEKGIWIEDPKPPLVDLTMRVKVDVDDTKVRELMGMLKEMQPMLDRLDRVTKDPKPLTEPHLRISVDRAGFGKILLNDQDVSGHTCGFTLCNHVGEGTMAVLELAPACTDITCEAEHLYFRVGERRFYLIEEPMK